MQSVILRAGTRLLVSLILMFSVYILFRGHNQPGGGFIGGLIAASGIILYSVAFGYDMAVRALRVPGISIAGMGIVFAVVAGIAAALAGDPFLTGLWYIPHLETDVKLALSTPLLFDIGVYFVVVGALTTIALELEHAGL